MIIKELELVNIRSYSSAVLRFPPGRTLLEGDIGSGKSSVLMAIEFALFGLGAEVGASILRLGEETGMVRIVLDVDGSECVVTRRLERRGGKVQQADGTIKVQGEVLSLSPSELKEKVLEVLEFDEPADPKAQSWIYRYAVYTPQEEMKGILSLPAEQRLQILRRAFRLEEYKTAVTNGEEASRELRGDVRELGGRAAGIEALRAHLERLGREEVELRVEVESISTKAEQARARVASLRKRRDDLRDDELGLKRVDADRRMNERTLREAEGELEELAAEIASGRERSVTLSGEIGGAEIGARVEGSLAAARREEEALGEKLMAIASLRAKAESKISDYQVIMKDGVCPVCDTRIKKDDFGRKTEAKELELAHVSEELRATREALVAQREKRERMEVEEAERRNIAAKKLELARVEKDIARMGATRSKAELRKRMAEESLEQGREKMKALEGVAARVKAAEREVVSAEEELRELRDSLASRREKLEGGKERKAEVAAEVGEKERAARRGKTLGEFELWLDSYFVPTVQLVEKSALANINQEFNALFQKWFGVLVSDPDKEVQVDEEFTPVITQGGYEQDVRYLSGGERTSVALAFRLALNILAQRVSIGLKSNLLILDEPTDGFSREQLGSVREVLDEVGSPQVIIVSHDKELESFADQIIRVRKEHGVSVLEVATGGESGLSAET